MRAETRETVFNHIKTLTIFTFVDLNKIENSFFENLKRLNTENSTFYAFLATPTNLVPICVTNRDGGGFFREFGDFKIFVATPKETRGGVSAYERISRELENLSKRLTCVRISNIVTGQSSMVVGDSFEAFTKQSYLESGSITVNFYADVSI